MEPQKLALQATYYNHNFGSVLQAFALKEFLNKYKIKTLLVSENYSLHERLYFGIKRRIDFFIKSILYPEIKIEQINQSLANQRSLKSIDGEVDELIDRFIDHRLYTVNLTYSEMKKTSRSDSCVFCLAGSDQIWNGSRVYINSFYFLTFAPRHKRISYAPSFGSKEIKRYNEKSYKRLINGFEAISVREKTGIDIIKKLCNRDAEWILDPVLLLSSDEWAKLCKLDYQSIPDNYIVAFFLNEPNENAKNCLKECYLSNSRIVTIGYESNLKNLDFPIEVIKGGPESFLALIKNARLICTDSFHATVFSMIFHKEFYTFTRSYINANQSNRLLDFLSETDLLERYEPDDLKKTVPKEMNYSLFDEYVENNKRNVIRYLNIGNGD